MKIRQRLRIMESNNQKDLKIKLFFLADQMGLSGWIQHEAEGLVAAEIQGEEECLNLYLEQSMALYHISKDRLICGPAKKGEAAREGLKIG